MYFTLYVFFHILGICLQQNIPCEMMPDSLCRAMI